MGCNNCVESSEDVKRRSTLEKKVAAAPPSPVAADQNSNSRRSSSSNRKAAAAGASKQQDTPPKQGRCSRSGGGGGQLSALTEDILRQHDEANAQRYNNNNNSTANNSNRQSNNMMENSFNTGGGDQHPPTTGVSLENDSNEEDAAEDGGGAVETEKEKRRLKRQEQEEQNWRWVSSISEPDILNSGDSSNKILAAMRASNSNSNNGNVKNSQRKNATRKRSTSTATTDFFDQVHAANRKADPSGRLNKIYGTAAGGMEASIRTNDSKSVQLPRKNNTVLNALQVAGAVADPSSQSSRVFRSDSQLEIGGSSEVSSANQTPNGVATPLEIDFELEVTDGNAATAVGGAILFTASDGNLEDSSLPQPTMTTPPSNISAAAVAAPVLPQAPEDVVANMDDTCNIVQEELSADELRRITEIEDIWEDDGGRSAKEPEDPCFWKEKMRKLQIAREKKRKELLEEQNQRKVNQMKRMAQLRSGASGRAKVTQSGGMQSGARSATVQRSPAGSSGKQPLVGQKATTATGNGGGGRRSSLQNPSKSTGALPGY